MAFTDHSPLVSVCIPAYNSAKYIGQTLASIIGQSYKHLEIVVVNDGSEDDTLKVITAINDTRLKLYDALNAGAATARNIACANARGDYLIFFDADDLMAPDFIASQMEVMAGRDDVVVLARWGRFYGDDHSTFTAEPIPAAPMNAEGWIKQYWYNADPMTNPGRALIPRKLVEEAGWWNEELSLNDDLEFFTRLFLKAKEIVFNRHALLKYRSGVKGLSGVKSREAYISLYQTILLSIDLVLSRYDDRIIRQSCANMWQSFIYELYPHYPELIAAAEEQMKNLPAPNLRFPAGGITQLLSALLGWKTARQIKQMLRK